MEQMRARVACLSALLLFLAAPGGTQINSRDRIASAIDSANVATVRGTAHPLAQSRFDQGRLSPAHQLSGVTLTFRLSAAQQADMDQLLREQQDRSSPSYHKWLTPEQYASRFGMTQNDLAKVTSWLQSQGLRVDGISRSRTEISFSGSVGQVEYALKTELHNYSINAEQHFANATDVAFPAAFSAQVLGVRGLNSFHPKPRYMRPAPRFTSSISGNHFVMPGDFATIYDVPSALDGTGQTIAVVGQTDISNTDIDAFRSAAGLSVNDPTVKLVPNSGTLVHSTGDETEADLDLEWAGGIAPKANIIYYTVGNGSNSNVFDSLNYAVQQNAAHVISISYGNCEANLGSFVLTLRQWAQQANAQGQTISGPSGDDGAADCDSNVTSATHGLAVDVPAAIPEVTGVGGTEFTGSALPPSTGDPAGAADPNNTNCHLATAYWTGSCGPSPTIGNPTGSSALSYIPETTWNDAVSSSGFSSGGGGASKMFGKPSWQTGTGVPADGKRDVPDVALNASNGHDSVLICSQDFFTGRNPPVTSCTSGFRASDQTFSAIGGTSVGAPSFAGILALMNQAMGPNGLGNVNPMLYQLAGTSGVFHAIASGTNKVPCTAGTTNCPSGTTSIGFSAGAGYDQVTGLGSPDVANLIAAWLAVTPTKDFSVDSLTSTIAAPGGQGSSTITITAENGFAGTVDLTCAPVTSAQITCSLSPSSVILAGGNALPQTAALTINTVAKLETPFGHTRGLWYVTGGGAIFAAVFLFVPSRRRWASLFGLVLLAFLAVNVACGGGGGGGGGGGNGTPAGTYSITVTGTSGALSHNTVLSLTVK